MQKLDAAVFYDPTDIRIYYNHVPGFDGDFDNISDSFNADQFNW